jgi:hypothetical protein
MKFTFMLVVILFVSSASVFSSTCIQKDTFKLFSTTIEKLNKKSSDIKKIIEGEGIQGYTASELFGYTENKPAEEVLNDLKVEFERNSGVSTENLSLLNCLKELKEPEKIEKLLKASQSVNLTILNLYKKNNELNNSLKRSMESNSTLPDLKSEISQEKDKVRVQKSLLEESIAIDDTKISSSSSTLEREFIIYTKSLKKIKVILLERKIQFNESLERKIEYFERKKPTDFSSFDDVEKVWQEVSTENLNQLFETQLSFNFPLIPSIPLALQKLDSDKKRQLDLLFLGTTKLRNNIIEDLTSKKESELKILNDLIVQVNNLRSALFFQENFGFRLSSVFSIDGVLKIKDEVLLSPYRLLSYLYSKYFKIRESLSKGREGYLNVMLLIAKYLFLLFFLYGIQKGIKWLEGSLSVRLRSFVLRSRSGGFSKRFYTFWNRSKEIFPEVFWLVVADTLSSLETFSSIKFVFDIIKILAISRVIKFSVTFFLGNIAMVTSSNFSSFKKKSDSSSDSFKNIYLTYAFAVLLVEAAVGKVYIYSLVSWGVTIFCYIKIMKTSLDWDGEFRKYLEAKFSGIIVEKFTNTLNLAPKKVRPLFLFLAILFLSFFNFFVRITENFTFSKKISANIFKKQIENVEANEVASGSIPVEYKERYAFQSLSNDELYVTQDLKLEDNIKLEIQEWINSQSEEHSLVIFGDKGIGKTSLIKHIKSLVSNFSNLESPDDKAVDCLYTKMPSKTLSKEDLQKFLCTALDIDLGGKPFDFPAIDKKMTKKKVVFIDECQNVFLSQTGGFDGYYYLTELINMPTENVFWFLSFNKPSWLYLNSAFDRTQFFRNVFELKGWSDEKVKELVMRRHDDSPYKLSYDLLINATRSQDELDKYASIESKFFKLLWELSRGNPRTALALWLTALSRKNESTFNVNIPKELDLADLDKSQDNQMFVLAHVLKHENLSLNEVVSTTHLPRAVVRNALKVALEKKYLYRDERSRYMIDITSQHIITKQLKAKNFLYGN